MAVGFSNTNKPINPRGNDASPKGYNRASLYSGKALSFDGVNDYVDLDGFTLSGTTATISFYYKSDSNKALAYIFDNTQRWVIGQADTTDSFGFYDGSTWRKSTQTLTIGEYYHITAVIEGGNVEFLWNGQSVGDTFTGANSISWASLTNFKLGWSYNASSIGQVNGQMAGFKIFNTALTAAQVADLYNNPEKVVPTGVDNTALKLWLPMQEGAGTTAYDGSGNGNHGTISGATYTHGIGAPVSQTAVIDWNKGVNLLDEYSEDFSNSGWLKTGSSISASSESNPYGKQTYEFEVTSLPTEVQVRGNISGSTPSSTAFKSFVIAKAGTLNWLRVRNLFVTGGGTSGNVWFNLSTGSVGTEQSSQTGTMTDLGDGWYKCEVSGTTASSIPNYLFDVGFTDTDNTNEPTATGGTGLLVLSAFSLNGIYIETLGSAQTSEVLLPQGITTGRDITGVNLFENVRKQGALNLDGNSWAEVHDNASLDVSEISAEGWMYAESITGTNNRIVNKWNTNYPERSFQLYGQHATINWMLSDGSSAYSITGGTLTQGEWHHVVGTYDGSTQKIYLNGVQVQSTALSITLKQSSFKVMLGGYATGVYTLNPIAQPRIYNRALTASEVLQNYNSGKNTYK